MKKYYSDYVRHCTRQYFHLESIPSAINDRVVYNNYVSVSNVLDRHDIAFKGLIRFAYTSESMVKAVEEYAFKTSSKTESVWYIIQGYEKEVAVERGLA